TDGAATTAPTAASAAATRATRAAGSVTVIWGPISPSTGAANIAASIVVWRTWRLAFAPVLGSLRQIHAGKKAQAPACATSEDRQVKGIACDEFSCRIRPVDWIVAGIDVEISSTGESDRVLAKPSPDARIIVAHSKAHQPRVLIVKTARKPERGQPRLR